MIEVKNVTKKYGNFYAVRNINFEVKEGEIVGFLGRNGAGKSTTMNMITGFIEPTEGDIIVGGHDISLEPKKVKAQIGYMPEGTPLYYDLTVKEFVSYMAELKRIPRKERKAAVEEAMKRTGLEVVKDNLTKNLSRGYRQRVSMAGAIVGNPKVLILDEPTVGLDPKQVIEIRELIKSFKKDHTVLVSSHILSEVSQMCEKVIIIDKGEIIAVDTPENLEKQTKEVVKLDVSVDDMNNKFESVKEKISAIETVELVEEKEDGTKNYVVTLKDKTDIRKELFSTCASENIIILEMKQKENSLEDAFITLVEGRKEYSQKEINKMQYEKEIEELRKEDEEAKEEKAIKKQAIKEEKARKKAKKEADKAAKNAKKAEKEAKEEKVEPAKTEEPKAEEVKANDVKAEESKTEEVKEESTENKEEGGDK